MSQKEFSQIMRADTVRYFRSVCHGAISVVNYNFRHVRAVRLNIKKMRSVVENENDYYSYNTYP